MRKRSSRNRSSLVSYSISDRSSNVERNMGFPLGYSEVFAPRLLLHLLYFLGHLRSLLLLLFHSAGLSDLLEPNVSPVEVQNISRETISDMLPVTLYKDLVDPPESCAVCLYEFEGGDETPWLSGCRHVFHRSCLDRWMDFDQDTCPICRARLIPDGTDPPEPFPCW